MSTISEKAFQSHVRAILDTYRWHHWHFHDSRRQVRPGVFVGDRAAAGFPDLVAVRGDRLIMRELKTDTGKLTNTQLLALEALKSAGVNIAVWRPADLASGLIQADLAFDNPDQEAQHGHLD